MDSSRCHRLRRTSRTLARLAVVAVVAGVVMPLAGVRPAMAAVSFEIQSLDGSGNNLTNPNWGRAGQPYLRVAPARYTDGLSAPVGGPNPRFISNRIFNDVNQNVFSERRVSQWGNVWGQFLDHTFGLAQDGGPAANIPFDSSDPLESFTNNLGVIPFSRNAAAPGTGTTNARQQVNTETSFIDAEPVYSADPARLEWLRDGPVNGNLADNAATLMLPGNYLPRRDSRGDASTAPTMALDGRLTGQPARAMVAGDVRANENIALTATHTLFAREHNRIVSLLPNSLSQGDKFQIARRVVIAEQQYITYNEFLPAMGVALPVYAGYNAGVNPTLSTEFATVGYRAHSQIHGETELDGTTARYSQAQLNSFEAQGLEVTQDGTNVHIAVPLNLAFFNPDLVPALQLGPLLQGIGGESEYRNDEMIDNQLRSVLFQIPVSGNPGCLDGPTLPQCFQGVVDLAAIDIARGRDHGMPSYNQLRQAYGLAPKTSFTAITGEATDGFPADPQLTPGNEINDPNSLDFMSLSNIDGAAVALGTDAATTSATSDLRRTTVAARLRAIYGNVNNVDAFVGMVSEPHVPGAEFGELQLAIWTRQFQALRDGDRFFYGNQTAALNSIRDQYGIDFHRSLAQLIASNTDIPLTDLSSNVFLVEDDELPPTTCTVAYTQNTSWPGGFQIQVTITNTGTSTINGWRVNWAYANGQQITGAWNSTTTQSGRNVTAVNASWNATLPPGGRVDMGFNASWDNVANGRPPSFTLNGARCAFG